MQDSHLHALRGKHDKLEDMIRVETARPAPDPMELRRLKEQKLHLREQMDRHERKTG